MKKGSRKERCKWGHSAWVTVRAGYRRCGVCHRERMREYRVAKRVVLVPPPVESVDVGQAEREGV